MKKNIKQRNKIPLFKVFMSRKVIKPLSTVLLSGYIGQGKKVEEFESLLAKFIKNPYIVTTNSGTSSLQLALRLSDVGPGDEVISTPMTCTATNWPILATGAKIVWADIDPENGNIDPKSIKALITKNTKAIMVVDWGGYPCDIDAIRKITGKIPIIEDAAHAFGSIYKGKMVGQSADFTCFSFQAIKHLTAGDGGALAVRKKNIYKRAKLLRWYGIDREKRSQENRIEIDVKEWGYKFHMNDINATVAIENFKHVRSILKKHRDNADFYKRSLDNLKDIKLLKETENFTSSYWLFTIRVKQRGKFLKYMNDNNISVSMVHRRNDTHPIVSEFKRKLSGLDLFSKEMVCIPVGWWINKSDLNYIAATIKEFNRINSAQVSP